MASQPNDGHLSEELELREDLIAARMPSGSIISDNDGPSRRRAPHDGDEASSVSSSTDGSDIGDEPTTAMLGRHATESALDEHIAQGQHFTIRSVLAGLVIGVLIAFSNAYFGLQTGWISGMVDAHVGVCACGS